MRGVYQDQLNRLNERAASLTADDAAWIRALEYEIERIDTLKETKKQFMSSDIQVVLSHSPMSEILSTLHADDN